jgi:hypothetical protein
MDTTTKPIPAVRFCKYGDPTSSSPWLSQLIEESAAEGMLHARAEDSGSEGTYCEVCIWNDPARRFERFAFMKFLGGEFEIVAGEDMNERQCAEYCAELINAASTAWNNPRLPIIHRMPNYEPTTADEVKARSPARVLDILRRLTRLAEHIDARDTKAGRGFCNGYHAGNVCTEGCALCDAGLLLAALDRRPAG